LYRDGAEKLKGLLADVSDQQITSYHLMEKIKITDVAAQDGIAVPQ
jgi:hypothetical protein